MMLGKLALVDGSLGSWWSGELLPLHNVCNKPRNTLSTAYAGWYAEAGFLPGILVYLTWWFPAFIGPEPMPYL